MKNSKLSDFDPESLLDLASSSSEDEENDVSSEEDVQAGREHYQEVAKSKLRKKEAAPLGKQYSGISLSREAIEDEDSDDPFAREYEIWDGEDEEEEEEEKFVNGNGVAHSESEEDVESDEEVEDFEEDDDREFEEEGKKDADQTAKIREMMDTTAISRTITHAVKSDIEKGEAIQTQRKTFDSLLNARIRLQKALISTNAISSKTHKDDQAPESAFEAAELASLKLLNTITDLRASLEEAHAGTKRKRTNSFTSSTTSRDILPHIQASELKSRPQRNQVLEKWSNKTRGAGTTLSASQGRLNASAQQTLVDVLNAQLQDSERLVKRVHIARSCAPNMESSESIYDDADLYSQWLKDLLEQRSSESTGEFIVQARELSTANKSKKTPVDTKASKGRKLRYTVHEKLENFMAPETRNSWGDAQREDLFTSLFGARHTLGEQDEVHSDKEEASDVEEEGLLLFRNPQPMIG